jgi:hypothetical protein
LKVRLFGGLLGMLTLAMFSAAVVPADSRTGFTFAISIMGMLIVAVVTSILREGDD